MAHAGVGMVAGSFRLRGWLTDARLHVRTVQGRSSAFSIHPIGRYERHAPRERGRWHPGGGGEHIHASEHREKIIPTGTAAPCRFGQSSCRSQASFTLLMGKRCVIDLAIKGAALADGTEHCFAVAEMIPVPGAVDGEALADDVGEIHRAAPADGSDLAL